MTIELAGTWTGAFQLVGWLTPTGQTVAQSGTPGNFVVSLYAFDAPTTPITTATVSGVYFADISGLFVAASTTAAAWTGTLTVSYQPTNSAG